MAIPKLLLVDGHALCYRAFYAIRNLTNTRGEPSGALYGFIKTLQKNCQDHQPTHWAVAFDRGTPSRQKDLPTYKSQRPPMPEDLRPQISWIQDWLTASRISILIREGEEADDLLATAAFQASRRGWLTIIATNDKDLAQLVSESIHILLPTPKEKTGAVAILDRQGVCAKFKVEPSQLVDYLSLLGDASDNIPGIEGVGPKTAVSLIKKFGTLDQLLSRLAEVESALLRQKIADNIERLRRNRALITLRTDMPLEVELDAMKIRAPDYDRLRPILERLGSKSLLAEAKSFQEKSQVPAQAFLL